MKTRLSVVCMLTATNVATANPHWDEQSVPKDSVFEIVTKAEPVSLEKVRASGVDSLRVTLQWNRANESFQMATLTKEKSGTANLVHRANDLLGSYVAELRSSQGELLGRDTIGTGSAFRKLTRALTFRFPLPSESTVLLKVSAENPISGERELVLDEAIEVASANALVVRNDIEVRSLKAATAQPAVVVNIYADGYSSSRKSQFFSAASKTVDVLSRNRFPKFENFEIRAVFAPSNVALGSAQDLGLPVRRRDSFLGLYYPYWDKFDRWYHVVYPTDEQHYRDGLAQVPYDYPVVLMDSSEYWGVGNYMELTAVPATNSSFSYLLLHEIGHYFGLNEEYEGGGPTELAFAPNIAEPWSQNITFQTDRSQIKWKHHIQSSTRIPTPSSSWSSGGPWGAYEGGYAETEPLGRSHKPGLSCVMNTQGAFCPICAEALAKKINTDIGQ